MKQKLLIAQAVQGSRSALESLVRQYYDAIYNYIFQRVRSRETAEDLTQDVFMRLTANISSYRPVSSFSAFLYRIARNRGIDYYRTHKEAEELTETAVSGYDRPQADETLFVQEMLRQLSPEQRECILLYYFHDLTYKEIAQTLQIAVPTAKSRVRRGLAYCRKWMEEAK